KMIMDSLRYWVTEMGVDGFRFDLATTLLRDREHAVRQDGAFQQAIRADPVLQEVKLIAEPWDVGPYGYQVGAFGTPGSEWNDGFRDYVRDYWRSQVDRALQRGDCLSRTGVVFGDDRGPGASTDCVA